MSEACVLLSSGALSRPPFAPLETAPNVELQSHPSGFRWNKAIRKAEFGRKLPPKEEVPAGVERKREVLQAETEGEYSDPEGAAVHAEAGPAHSEARLPGDDTRNAPHNGHGYDRRPVLLQNEGTVHFCRLEEGCF